MARVLLEEVQTIAGLTVFLWTLIWLAGGFLVGILTTVLTVRLLCKPPTVPEPAPPVQTESRGASPTPAATEPVPGASKLLSSAASGMALGSGNHLDGSISFRTLGGLGTVSEHELVGAEAAVPAHAMRGKVNDSNAELTTRTTRLPANRYKAGGTAHHRDVSSTSVGPSVEYEEDDLDDDWKALIREVDTLLISKNKEPIKNARERATVVNSLLVSTCTRQRHECIRNAAIDMLTFRKMHERPGLNE